MQIPTMWAKKLIKLDDIKIFDLKREIGIEWSANCQIVHWWKKNTNKWRSKGMQVQTGISYPMHTTVIPILTSGSMYVCDIK